MRSALAIVGLIVCVASAAQADVRGRPRVIDGHTIEIAGEPIRLFGIEAPARDQSCTRDGRSWPCGLEAEFALAFELAEHWVTCHERGRDGDNRVVAICFMGPYDIAAHMVRLGWVRALRTESPDYVNEEKRARVARIGIWRGDPPPGW